MYTRMMDDKAEYHGRSNDMRDDSTMDRRVSMMDEWNQEYITKSV